MLDSEGDTKDRKALDEFKKKIAHHHKKFTLLSFFSIKNTAEGKRKRPNEDVGGSGEGGGGSVEDGGGPGEDGGAGSVRATDCAELRAEGYEVIPEEGVIVDKFGGCVELLVQVRQPLPTYMQC